MKKFSLFVLLFSFLIFTGRTFALGNDRPLVTFTFDDAPESVFTNAYPILNKFGYAATTYLSTKYIGGKWYLKWDQVSMLSNAGWDIGSHGYDHRDLTELPIVEMKEEISRSVLVLAEHGIRPVSFSSPYGKYDREVIKEVGVHFESHRKGWGSPNGLNDMVKMDQYVISPFSLDETTTFEEVKKLIDTAASEGKWLVFLAHEVVQGKPGPYQVGVDTFQKIVEYVARKEGKVLTVKEVVKDLIKQGKSSTVK